MCNSNHFFISVIIPVYHDWRRLLLCIDALKCQSVPADNFEVIIVNNDPQDIFPEGLCLPENFNIINEKKVGSYAARNAGLSVAVGNIIAFTDSDCTPDPDWLRNSVEYLKNRADRVAGEITLFYQNEKKLTASEIYEKVYAFRQDKAAKNGVSATANLIVWRIVIDKVGYFDEKLLSGGDTEWNKRATLAGFNIVYGENCVVKHPARHSLKNIVDKRRRVVGGNFTSHGVNLGFLLKGFFPPVKAFQDLKNRSDLTLKEKIISVGVLYILKMVHSFFLIGYASRLLIPTRK